MTAGGNAFCLGEEGSDKARGVARLARGFPAQSEAGRARDTQSASVPLREGGQSSGKHPKAGAPRWADGRGEST